MTEGDLAIVDRSFRRLVSQGEDFGVLFYDTLFRSYPDLRSLFPSDMRQQQVRLVQMLRQLIDSAHAPADMPGLAALARRHVEIGIRPEYFSMFGQALFESFAVALDGDFTPEVRTAWERAYTRIAGVLMRAMSGRASG